MDGQVEHSGSPKAAFVPQWQEVDAPQDPDQDPVLDMGAPLSAIDPPEEATVRVEVAKDLTDIAEFGNSEVSSSRDGTLRYDIVVTGIDTSDVRESFRQAITDAKLVWDTANILRTLKDGEVKMINVSPAKAFMVISRLRNLPVKVRWEQHAISQST